MGYVASVNWDETGYVGGVHILIYLYSIHLGCQILSWYQCCRNEVLGVGEHADCGDGNVIFGWRSVHGDIFLCALGGLG